MRGMRRGRGEGIVVNVDSRRLFRDWSEVG